MLVLSRKIGERIFVGDNIVIEVLEFQGTSVRLGISAPLDVSVHREEIVERIKQEGRRDER